MYCTHPKVPVLTKLLIILAMVCLGTSVVIGQSKQLLSWKEALDYLQRIPAAELEDQRDAIIQIRSGVESWLRLRPGSNVQLQSAPPQPWNPEQMLQEVSALREAVVALLKEDRGQPFDLGTTVISVTAETSPLSPVTDGITLEETRRLRATNAVDAIQYLPGLNIDFKSRRNQSGIMIRGFDTRQVGIYLDNVPLYVPYDGYADIGRYLTNDIAEIQVAKGFSSPLLGPNGLAGAINLVSRQPEKKFEGDLLMGTGTGDILEAGAHIGSRWDKFFFRGGMDWLQTDYFPLSRGFRLNATQPGFKRINADKRDVSYTGRVGYTPRDQDQYVFTYIKQKADYGAPPYSGIDPENNKISYWRWPRWNRDSYYFTSNTGLGESNALKFRAFYDKYPNILNMYKDSTYSSLTGAADYDDYSAGFSGEFSTRILPRHTLSASFFLKDDTHKSAGFSVNKKGKVTEEPWRTARDHLISIGIQDAITLSPKLSAIVGFSADYLNGIEAEDLNEDTNPITVVPFECDISLAGGPHSACLADDWAYNPLASISYSVSNSGSVYFSFARKSHFPTLKDRYSYKNGKAVPNPTIKPEHGNNWGLGYSHVFPFKTTMIQLELFRSDVYDAIQQAFIPAEFPDQCPELSENTCQKSINVGKELHQGVEFTIRSNPLSRLTVNANYTFVNRNISGPSKMVDVFPTGMPKHKIVATGNLRLPHEIMLMGSIRYESGRTDTNNSGDLIPASNYATVDFGGIIPIVRGMDLQLGVRNLGDCFYYYKEGFPQSGRNWYLNMRYRF